MLSLKKVSGHKIGTLVRKDLKEWSVEQLA